MQYVIFPIAVQVVGAQQLQANGVRDFADLNRVHQWNLEFIASRQEGRRYEEVADGIERALQLRHGVTDMRDIVEGDARFSEQFGMEV